jgi:hypothetical protein
MQRLRMEIQVTERLNKSINSQDAKKDWREEQQNGIQFSVYNC